MSELVEDVEDCRLLATCRFAASEALLNAKLVGENAVSPELGGLACPGGAVDMGVKPRRELPLFQTLLCCCWPRALCCDPELAVVDGRGGLLAEEDGG